MKIYDSNTCGAPVGGSQRTQETKGLERSGNGRSSAAGESGGDRVEFSGALERLSRTLSSQQSERASKVQALTAQYQNGTYRTDSAAVGRAMISEALSGGPEIGMQ
jgi:flagellar biosynthesis anti-sigma factor FlgM